MFDFQEASLRAAVYLGFAALAHSFGLTSGETEVAWRRADTRLLPKTPGAVVPTFEYIFEDIIDERGSL